MARWIRIGIVLVIGITIGHWAATRGGDRARPSRSAPARQDATPEGELWLGDFESEAELTTQWKTRGAAATRAEAHATHGRFAAKVTFQDGDAPALILSDALRRMKGWQDWRGYEALHLDIYNAESSPQRLLLQVKDRHGGRYKDDRELPAESMTHLTIRIQTLKQKLDLKHITQINLFQWRPKRPTTFYVDAVHLRPPDRKDEASGAETRVRDDTPPLAEAAITPHRLGGDRFAQHRSRWQAIDPVTQQPVVQVPLTLVTPGLPLSAGFPITGGVPFAMGQLPPGAAVRLRDDAKTEWPVQTRPLATWKDGSIKWLQVTTAVPPTAVGKELWLEYGDPVTGPPSAPSPRVSVEETPKAVTVTTGPLRFAISTQRFTLFESAHVDRNGDGVFTSDERLAGGGDLILKHKGREFRSSHDPAYTLEVEEAGPLRATLKASGWFQDARGKPFCRFTVRLQAFAGLPQVRVYHTFVYTGYPANTRHHEYTGKRLPDNETIQGISLELDVPGAKGRGASSPVTFMTADEQGVLAAPLTAETVVVQHDDDAYQVRRGSEPARSGVRNEGWALVQNAEAGVMVGVRDAWQQYPKELSADPASGRLTVRLWPADAGELNLETGPTAYGPDAVARGSAFGLAKTHEIVFSFLGRPVDQEIARSLASLWSAPWLLAAHPVWLEATDAWRAIRPVAWEVDSDIESMLERLFGWAERQPRHFGWYGMLDYGDTRLWYRKSAYDKSYDTWGWHPEGRWGWHNNEAVGTQTGALIGFMRTLNLSYFNMAEAKVRHVMDVDTVHHNTVANDPRLRKQIPDTFSQVGSMHRHNADHWGGRNEEATHTHVEGLLLYYYLTGYDRAWDVANEVGGFLLRDPITYTKHPDIAPLRAVANVLWGDVLLYEATWDPRYREGADRWAKVLVKGQRKDGAWLETYDPTAGSWTGKVKQNYITYHALPALIAYHRLTGNDMIARAILRGTDTMLKKEKFLQAFDAAAYSFLLTGNRRYLDEGRRRLEALVAAQQHDTDPARDGMVFKKAIYDRVTPILYTVPFFLGATDATDFSTLTASLRARRPAPAAAEAPYEVQVVPSLEKVVPDAAALPPGSHPNPASVSLARNEYEAVQLVLRSPVPLEQVSVELNALQQVGGTGVIGPEALAWSPVGFVKTERPDYDVSRVGWWPDPLPAASAFDVAPERWQPIWLTVYAPPGTPAGTYTGRVTIRPSNAPAKDVAVTVLVWDFDLPRTPTLKSAFDVYLNRIVSGYSEFFPEWWARWQPRAGELAQRFYEDLVRHRLAPILNLDADDPEALRAVKRLRDLGLSAFAIGRHSGSFDNNWPDDANELARLEPTYRRYAYELREAGLLGPHYIYTYDEPKPGLPKVAKVARMIHAADPALKNLVAVSDLPDVESLEPWLEDIDILSVRNREFDPAQAERLTQMGKELWLYVSGPKPPYPTLVIDYPSMAYRVLPWMCWKYGIKGLLYWSVNYWTTNPYENPMNTTWGQNGNGSLYYPGPEGPVPSIRLEVLRDGMEDYEYLQLLAQRLAAVRADARLMANGEVRALAAQAERLLAVDPALVASMRDYARDPGVLLAQRRAIAETIERLQAWLAGEGAAMSPNRGA